MYIYIYTYIYKHNYMHIYIYIIIYIYTYTYMHTWMWFIPKAVDTCLHIFADAIKRITNRSPDAWQICFLGQNFVPNILLILVVQNRKVHTCCRPNPYSRVHFFFKFFLFIKIVHMNLLIFWCGKTWGFLIGLYRPDMAHEHIRHELQLHKNWGWRDGRCRSRRQNSKAGNVG